MSATAKRVCALPTLLMIAMLASSQVFAEETNGAPGTEPRFSGFATLGLTHNDNEDVGAIMSFAHAKPARQGLSANLDSVVGLQMDWQPLPTTSFVVQGVARAAQEMEPELRMGYIRQQFGSDLAMRVGRYRSPLYFDSDVSEIGYAYLMSRPPIPLYGIASNVAYGDGADLQWRHAVGNASILAQAFYANSKYTHHFYNTDPVEEADAKLKDIRGLVVSATLPNIAVRASRTWVNKYETRTSSVNQLNASLGTLSGTLNALANQYNMPALAAQAHQVAGYRDLYNNRPIYTSIGFDANHGAWRLLGEWAQFASQNNVVGKYIGQHLTVARSFGDLTPYVSFSRMKRNNASQDLSALTATHLPGLEALDAGIAATRTGMEGAASLVVLTTHSVSMGMRWDFKENMALKMQYDHLWTPNAMTPGYFAVKRLPIDNKVNLFTVALDIVF